MAIQLSGSAENPNGPVFQPKAVYYHYHFNRLSLKYTDSG